MRTPCPLIAADMQEMVGTMTNALPHLAPPPRVRGKRGRGEDEELG